MRVNGSSREMAERVAADSSLAQIIESAFAQKPISVMCYN